MCDKVGGHRGERRCHRVGPRPLGVVNKLWLSVDVKVIDRCDRSGRPEDLQRYVLGIERDEIIGESAG